MTKSDITTKLRFSFRSKNQSQLFMIWREYFEQGKFAHDTCLFVINYPQIPDRFSIRTALIITTLLSLSLWAGIWTLVGSTLAALRAFGAPI
jgi:hypothetical protein